MKCPQCTCKNPETYNFCSQCGHRLVFASTVGNRSVDFNKDLEKVQRYFPRGVLRKILSQKERLEGERKQVTVMFCDMEGFTRLIANLDSAEAYQTMDKIYEILIRSVHKFEGTVNEMTGDGIMALFGAPIALENAPQRAIRSAMAIHRLTHDFSSQQEGIGPIRMRIGINTGPVVVGTLGSNLRLEFKAVGDTVNLASRMEGLADPGTTYVTAETYKQTRQFFHFERIGNKVVKGKTDPIPVYKVLSAKQDVDRPRLGSERMIYSRLIGRSEELNRLERQLMELADGKGSVISIIGEAGVGKSRLVAELKLREVTRRIVLIEGRAVAIGRNLGLHPIIDLLKMWAGIRHEDSDTIAFGKLETALRGLFPEKYQARMPVVASLMGIKGDDKGDNWVESIEGESLEKLILENVRALLAGMARRMPLVVILEDLHWADTSSIELLEVLFKLVRNERIAFINVFRPGYQETGERIVDSINAHLPVYHLELFLHPLDEQRCESLISNMLCYSALDHTVVTQIVNRAGGNPYFIEEIVRSMIDEGALTAKNGTFQTTAKIASINIPNTIHDVLMSRIDAFEDATRDIIMIAAIVGRTFQERIIRDVAEGIGDIDARLSHLKEMQIISEFRRTREVEYRFKHGLAQEAVYLSMLPQKRRKLHLMVAKSIEQNFPDKLHEYYGILSYHFNQGEDFDKAETYMLMAGNEAMKISASNEALKYYKTAMELYINNCGAAVDQHRIAALEENIAIAFFSKSNFVEAVKYFERSLKGYGVRRFRNPFLVWAGTIVNLIRIILSLYGPGWKKKKKMPPSGDDIRIMNLKFKLAMSLAYVDINRVFVDNIGNLPQAFKLDITRAPVYVEAMIGLSGLFAATGISFGLSRKILTYVDDNIFNGPNETRLPKNLYRFIESLYNCLSGNWHQEFNPDHVQQALHVGDVSYASGYLFWIGYGKLEHGDVDTTRKIIAIENEIARRYHFEHTKIDACLLASKLALVENAVSEASAYIDDGILTLHKYDLDMRKIEFNGLKLKIVTLQNDLASASKLVRESDDLIIKVGKKAILPNYYGEHLIGKLRYCLSQLELSIERDHKTDFKHHSRLALVVAKQNADHFKKRTAVGRTEAYRLIGRYYWLVRSKPRALKWYHKSILEGQRLKAELELKKTLDEVERIRNVTIQPRVPLRND